MKREAHRLDSPAKGLYIKNNVWREFLKAKGLIAAQMKSAGLKIPDSYRFFPDFSIRVCNPVSRRAEERRALSKR